MAAEQVVGWQPASIALVDLSYLWKKSWHAQPRDAQPGHAAQEALNQLAGIRESVEHVIVCLDAPPYRRREISPEYKAHRPAPESEELAQKKWLLERIEKDGYVIARSKGYEADDVIYTLAAAYGAWCNDVRIVASDKDLAYCVRGSVRMFVPAVGERPAEERGEAEIRAKYGVDPADMPLWLALCGDSSDNIPGVPGIGPKKAAELIGNCIDLQGIAETLAIKAQDPKAGKIWESLATHWEQLRLSLKLATLEKVPTLDAQALLVRREPAKLVEDEESEEMQTGSSYTNQDVQDADFVPISRAPEGYVAPPVETAAKAPSEPPPPKPDPEKPASLAKTHPEYGIVTDDLQPQDLRSAKTIARWVYEGRLYPQFPTPESIFTIIMRGKEMGLGVTTSLAGFHIVEGRPCASADLIRSLAERHPDCEYFQLIESDAKSATWETKHKRHPKPTRYTYTIEEAEAAGLLRPSRSGKPSPWQTRPRDMLAKTAGSKLARICYSGAVLGLYAPEEFEAA